MVENHKKPKGAGKSSFDLIDSRMLADALALKPGAVVLDLACGRGDYALFFSGIVGDQGLIYALDLWKEGLEVLDRRIEEADITNIMCLWADAAESVPVDAYSDVEFGVYEHIGDLHTRYAHAKI